MCSFSCFVLVSSFSCYFFSRLLFSSFVFLLQLSLNPKQWIISCWWWQSAHFFFSLNYFKIWNFLPSCYWWWWLGPPFFIRPKLLLAMAIHSLSLLFQLFQSLESWTFLLFFKLRFLNFLIANDGNPPFFFPLSILLKLRALSFVVDVFEFRVQLSCC